MQAKINVDLEFVRRVYHELGENHRALSMCHDLLDQLASSPENNDAVIGFRSLIIEIMEDELKEDDDATLILAEYDKLYTQHLTRKDRVSAAKTLLRICSFFDNRKDYKSTYETANKIISDFGNSQNEDLQGCVAEAHSFLFEKAADGDLGDVCQSYAAFLARASAPLHEAVNTIIEIDDALDGKNNWLAVKIIQDFLEARIDVDKESRRKLLARQATNYLALGENFMTLNIILELITETNEVNNIDYLLWFAEALFNSDSKIAAAVIFQGIIQFLDNNLDDPRRVSAIEFLEKISLNRAE